LESSYQLANSQNYNALKKIKWFCKNYKGFAINYKGFAMNYKGFAKIIKVLQKL